MRLWRRGEEFEVLAEVEPLDPKGAEFDIALHLPEGWKFLLVKANGLSSA